MTAKHRAAKRAGANPTSKLSKESNEAKQTLFQKISLYFFRRPRKTALIWLIVAVFGIASYSTLLKREGFPSIETPFAMMKGTYLVNDAAKVDREVGKPTSEFILKQSGVKSVQTQSFDNFFTAQVSYEESVNAETKSAEIQKALIDQKILPSQATGTLEAFKFGYTERGDNLVISFYDADNSTSTAELADKARAAAKFLQSQNMPLVESVSIIEPFESATNPLTGQTEQAQKSFDRFGTRQNDTNNFYNSVVIGVKAKDGADELELDKQVKASLTKLNDDATFKGYTAVISGSNAPNINTQIDELQRTLLEGLLAVLIIGSIVIAIRASLITVLSMVTVISATLGLLYLLGYTLNTITLFALILGLALIVDDTIIMVEAIDAQRRKRKDPDEVVKVATGKVGKAMIAATSTAALSFAPLLFVGGILGEFIRAIPITIISALVISLLVALIFIPLFSRYLLLGKKQLGEKNVHEASAGIEAAIARFLSTPMLWAKHSRKKLFGVGIAALIIGFGFIGAGGYIFREVKFSIFPTDKDSNQLNVTLTFAPNTDIETAEQVTDKANKIVASQLGSNFEQASYYSQTGVQNAVLNINITDYKKRAVTAPQLVDQLDKAFEGFEGANVEVGQVSAGPPASAFNTIIDSSSNRQGAINLGNDVAKYMQTMELKRVDGSIAKISSTTPPNPAVYLRDDNKQYVKASAEFVDEDTSALVTLAQQAVEKEFPKSRVASYGLDQNALSFDFGQESENQDSFKTLAIAFPLLLVVIYILLATQFRSLLQPLLIFMAIPFSLFGIALGLKLTNNPFSFFTMLGFFALIGLSIKNTILLTDYANQSRRAGMDAVDAAHEALAERFRPLIATSLTAVVSLIPLAITSPFWEGLAVVLIFGLLSSTFLVITVFPYYYLGSEFLRSHISRLAGVLWVVFTIGILAALIALGASKVAIIAPILAGVVVYAIPKAHKKRAA